MIFLFRRNELRREVSAAVNREVGGEAAGLAHPATDSAAQLVRARRVKLRAGAALVNELARKYEERARVAACVEIKILRRGRAESSRRP